MSFTRFDVTPEHLFRQRRQIIKALGIGSAAALLPTISLASTQKVLDFHKANETQLMLTPENKVTGYNNFYGWDSHWMYVYLDKRPTKRPYLILGSVAFLILAMMAITSLPSLKQTLGKRWFSLHQWSYIALAAAAIHYYWSVKSLTIAPIVVGCVTLFILAVRLIKNK